MEAFLLMGGVGIGPDGFLVGMVLFEGDDGEAVDDHAWGFGVDGDEGEGGRGELMDELVDAFHAVVAFLVVFIDIAFSVVDVFIAEVVAAGVVFPVPEEEVIHMVGLD